MRLIYPAPPTRAQFEKKHSNSSSKDILRDLVGIFDSFDLRSEEHIGMLYSWIKEFFSKTNLSSTIISDASKEFTRGRLHKEKGTLFTNISELSYPPKEYTSLGRGNLSSRPILYASNDPGTCIYEVKPNIGDWITLYTFEIVKPELELITLGTQKLKNENLYNSLTPLDKALHDLFIDLFRREVANAKYEYLKTAFLIHGFVRERDGIVYPSFESSSEGYNIVFAPEYYDDYAQFRHAAVHELVEFDGNKKIKVRPLFRADELIDDLHFSWYKHEGEIIEFDLSFYDSPRSDNK